MTIEQNKIIANRFIMAIGSLDPVKVGAFMSDTCSFLTMASSSELPVTRQQSGAEYCKQMILYAASILRNGLRFEITGMVAEGNFVAAEATCVAEVSGGGVYSNAYHFLLEIIDGKIQTVKEYCDFLHAFEALVPAGLSR